MESHRWSDFYVGNDLDNLDFDDDFDAPPGPPLQESAIPTVNSGADAADVPLAIHHAREDDHAPGKRGSDQTQTDGATVQKKRKTQQATRTKIFQLHDATTKATEYVTDVLQNAPSHEILSQPFKIAKLTVILATTLLLAVGTDTFVEFCEFLIGRLWEVVTAGDRKPMMYAETLVMHFHAFRIDGTLLRKWDSLLDSFQIKREDLESDCLLQHILDCLLEKLLTDRNAMDLPVIESIINKTEMNKHEEQVLSYVAGYIPFAMLKHYKKILSNVTAQKYVDILTKWSATSLEQYKGQFSFLEYTTHWIQAQSRGKLFQPNPHVFLFFRAAENESRKHVSTSLIGKYRDTSLHDLLMQKLSSNYLIQQYWTKIVDNTLSCDESKLLLKETLNYYVNIRCRAFVLVYSDLKKLNDKTVSKKSTKSLRKQLNKEKNTSSKLA